MSSTTKNPIWVSFPRWMEESGIPVLLAEHCHPSAWLVFRKLVEVDCDTNLTPNYFLVRFERLSRWLGMPIDSLIETLSCLEKDQWIELRQIEEHDAECRIVVPVPSPLTEAEIRVRLHEYGVQTGHYILRYLHDIEDLNRSEKVIFLYQMIFGLKFTPRIVEDLEEIANTYDMAVIYEVFSEAYTRKSKSLSWIRSRLNKKSIKEEESM